MPETTTVEETIEVLPVKLAIAINSPVGIAVTALATYGAVHLTNDTRRLLSKVRENRKAKKVAETPESPQPPQI